jgi:pseudouridine kinase
MSDHFSPAPDGPVLAIGAAGVDMVGRLDGELRWSASNPSRIRSSFGGVARNVAENLARLGQPVRLLTAVGEDQSGEQLIRQASEAGVDMQAVLRTPAYPTGAYLAVLDADGELQLALDDMRAVQAITPAYLNSRADLFLESSLLFLDANLSPRALRTAVSLARRAHIPICVDPTSSLLASRLRPYLENIHLITPSSAEACVLSGCKVADEAYEQALDAAKRLVSQGVQVAMITLAEAAVVYATSTTTGQAPAICKEIIDPIGGGDALAAAVIFALLNDFPLDDAVRLGVSAAALTLGSPGAVVPDLSLQKLYDQLVI